MKYKTLHKWLVLITGILALIAAGAGLFNQTLGEPYPYTNHRAEKTLIFGQGLYYYDTVSSAAQMQGNDLVTLIIGLPLLVISTFLAIRSSLGGKFLLTGTLGFFLYTYMSMATLASYKAFFQIYIAIFTQSCFDFIFT